MLAPMRSKAMLALLMFSSGCGGARPEAETTPEVEAPPPTPPTPAAASTPEAREAWEPTSYHRVVSCDFDYPRAEVPDEPVLFASGPVQVRAQSLVFDRDAESSDVMFCVPYAPLPEGTRLVLLLSDYEVGATTWDGARIAGQYVEEPGEPGVWDTETLANQTVTTVREMAYCPNDPSRACIIAGDYAHVSQLPSTDPNGPRSGWDFTETALTPRAARRGGRTLTADACGLTVTLRGNTDCEGTTLEALNECFTEHYANAIYDPEGEPTEPGSEVQLVLADRTQEVAIEAYSTARIACVEGVVVAYQHSLIGFGSTRTFAAIDVANQRIRAARRMTIVDHEEARSDCANAWDGVELVPIIGSGALLGAVVFGAGASPRFDVSRGDAGDARFVESAPADEESEDYEAPTAPLAYRVRGGRLAPIDVANVTRPEACPLRVSDEDGQTNVRPDPSTRRPPVGTIPTGTVIETVEQRGRWYRIEQPHAGWLWSGSLSRRCTP